MKTLLFYLILLLSYVGFTQDNLDELLKKYNDQGVPYISVEELASPETKAILLDSREPKEYKTSHIRGATCIGYDNFNLDSIKKSYPNKDKKIVVYCSISIRSETIGEKLKKAGYTNVYNLYGGIFEWINQGNTVVDSNGITNATHAYDETWGIWLTKGRKVYD